jgi:signal transduction histidine kinase
VRYRATARERAIEEVKSREREELARELHDTVAHHVSAIAVQAQAGRTVAASDPERAAEVLAVIEEAASRTLEEMRAMVGTLRGGAEADLAPQQGVADLGRLAGERPGGLRVDVDVDPAFGRLGPAVDSAIYRIAQESVTNAVRHARRASRIRVELRDDGDLVRLSVTDDGDVVAIGPVGGGFGLLGMTERAELVGGRLEAGPAPGAGWRVVAVLPRTKASP